MKALAMELTTRYSNFSVKISGRGFTLHLRGEAYRDLCDLDTAPIHVLLEEEADLCNHLFVMLAQWVSPAR